MWLEDDRVDGACGFAGASVTSSQTLSLKRYRYCLPITHTTVIIAYGRIFGIIKTVIDMIYRHKNDCIQSDILLVLCVKPPIDSIKTGYGTFFNFRVTMHCPRRQYRISGCLFLSKDK